MDLVIFNSTNSEPRGNDLSRFVFQPSTGTLQFPNGNYRVALASASLYYSWENIRTAYNNNSFQYIWQGTTFDVDIPDGSYSISQINSYLQSVMIANDHYLINAAGDNVYYLEMITNPTQYAIQLNCYPIPTALPAGWSQPAGWSGYPASLETPQFVIENNDFQNTIGILSGTYPPAPVAIDYSKLSDFTPQVSVVQSVLVRCNLLKNKLSIPNDILYSFAISDVSFGSTIEISPPELLWGRVEAGSYNNIELQFLTQDFQPLPLQDINLTLTLVIKDTTIEI